MQIERIHGLVLKYTCAKNKMELLLFTVSQPPSLHEISLLDGRKKNIGLRAKNLENIQIIVGREYCKEVKTVICFQHT